MQQATHHALTHRSTTGSIKIEHQGKSIVIFHKGERIGSFPLADVWDLVVNSLRAIDGKVNREKEAGLARRVYEAINVTNLVVDYMLQEKE